MRVRVRTPGQAEANLVVGTEDVDELVAAAVEGAGVLLVVDSGFVLVGVVLAVVGAGVVVVGRAGSARSRDAFPGPWPSRTGCSACTGRAQP